MSNYEAALFLKFVIIFRLLNSSIEYAHLKRLQLRFLSSLSLSHISISEFALWFWQLDDLHSLLPPPTPCLCLVSMGQGCFSLLLMIAHLAGLLQLHLFLIKFWLTDSHTRTATHTHTPSHTDTHNYSDICNYAAPCLTLD